MEYSDLPSEAQSVFDQAAADFQGNVDEAAKQKYVDGLKRAANDGAYAEGLANKFNMSTSDFSGVAGLWDSAVSNADADQWEDDLKAAGIQEKFRDNLVIGLTESG